MKHIKLIALGFSLVVLSVLAVVGVAGAQSFRTGKSISVAENETIDSSLFVSGGNINIAGNIKGDVYCAGQNITISGTISGDVFCAGQTVIISGTVEGGVRLGGQSVTLSGSIGTSATIATQNLIIEKDATIERDLTGGGQSITINGQVKRDVVIGSESMTINGRVGRNVKGGTDSLVVGAGGVIGGDVDYTGRNDPEVSKGGRIAGKVTRSEPEDMSRNKPSAAAIAAGSFIYMLVSMMAIGLVLVGLFPRQLNSSAATALKSPGRTVLMGLLAMIVAPVIIILLFASIIGIPLAILATLVWITILILSGPFAAFLLGKALLNDSTQPIWAMALGIAIIVITYFIPIIGFVAFMVTMSFGTGMILMHTESRMFSRTKVVENDKPVRKTKTK